MATKKIINSLFEVPELNNNDRKLYSKVFSDKLGIINAVLRRNDLKEYGYSMFQSLSAKTTILFGRSREVSSGGLGINKSGRIAFHACMGESIERYCMSFYDKKNFVNSTYKKLPGHMRFKKFFLYSDKQYTENATFANPLKSKIYWDKIESFTDPGKFKYWPASLVYLPFEEGKMSAETTSTGMAASTKKTKAIMNGLMELIERDALMLNFLHRLNPPKIVTESINDSNKVLIRRLQKNKYKINIYKLYSDIDIPIFVGLISKGTGKNTHYGIGACASLSSENAINKTLEECLFTFMYSKNIMDSKPKSTKSIKALYEHFLYYQNKNFDKLIFKSKLIDYRKEKRSPKYLFKKLRELNLEIYFKELTTEDVISTKIKVFRVIVPGLIDLNKSHSLPRIGADRLWLVPKKLGLKIRKKLSPLPHPFP